jgi:hypothetical protein
MIRTITAGTAMLFLATAAIAQTTPGTFTTTQQGVFMNEQGTMRTQEDARTRFKALTAEEQATLRATCTQMQASGTSGSTTDTTTTGSTTGTASGGTTATTTMQMADMQQACQWVQGF